MADTGHGNVIRSAQYAVTVLDGDLDKKEGPRVAGMASVGSRAT